MARQRKQRRVGNFAGAILALGVVSSSSASAQTHKVAPAPENVVRAIGVYEWIGDMAKPTASRIIPISLFIDGKLQDAGIYLARPVPFALLTGNIYELDQSGVAKGTVDLLYSRHFVATDNATTTYDDGWFGYGTFVPPAPPRKEVASLKPARTSGIVSNAIDNDDDDKPHFSAKSAKPGTGGSADSVPAPTASTDTPPADPDRPTMHRPAGTSDTTSSGSTTASTTPAGDPDRPTMRRRSDTSDTTATADSSKTSDSPADDPDRPTLRRRAPEDAKKSKTPQASVSDVGSLNDDPNRPTLHRGKSAGAPSEADFPKLSGLPGDQDLHQMIAVSDAMSRPPHDFSRKWDDEAEHQAILGKMQASARAQLATYEAAASGKKPAALSAPDARHPNSKLRRNLTPEKPQAPEPLVDEQLTAYTLSYGGSATFVYSAHTGGLGSAQCFVTLVAQVDMQGEPAFALKSVTDATHLDRTPRLRLVDAVDAEASNRASLLFELREQNARQFALYRVIGARADQIFLTGTTQ